MAVKHYLSEEVSKINLELYHLKEKNKLYQSKISLEESHHRDENTVLHLAFELLNKQNQLILNLDNICNNLFYELSFKRLIITQRAKINKAINEQMINKFLDKLYTQGLILDEKQKEIDRLRKKNSFTINVSQFNHKYTDKDILSSDNQTFSLYNDNVLDRNMETLNNLVSLQNEAETFNIKENNMRWNGLNELGNENSGETSYKKEEVNDEDYTGINIRGSREFPIEGNAPLVQPLKKKNLKAKPEVGESTKILMGIFNKNTKRKGSSSAKNKLFCPKKKNDSKTHLTPTSPSGIIEIGYSNKFLCRNYQILTQYYKQLENSTQDVHSSNIREIKTNRGECKKINECYYIPKGTLRSSKSDNDIKENSS